MRIRLIVLGLLIAAGVHAATEEDVGDADSFGRKPVYLGIAQTPLIALQEDCTPDPDAPPQPGEQCVTLNAQPAATNFNAAGLDHINLPAAATSSMLCFELTPIVTYQFNNLTGLAQPNARFTARATITIANDVLNDPALIDPATGLPYGGRMTVTLTMLQESRSIAPNERALKNSQFSRHCIGGLVSKSSLVFNGLSPLQATLFFTRPMTLTFGAQGTAQIVDFATVLYGIRLYGDR